MVRLLRDSRSINSTDIAQLLAQPACASYVGQPSAIRREILQGFERCSEWGVNHHRGLGHTGRQSAKTVPSLGLPLESRGDLAGAARALALRRKAGGKHRCRRRFLGERQVPNRRGTHRTRDEGRWAGDHVPGVPSRSLLMVRGGPRLERRAVIGLSSLYHSDSGPFAESSLPICWARSKRPIARSHVPTCGSEGVVSASPPGSSGRKRPTADDAATGSLPAGTYIYAKANDLAALGD